MKKREPRSLLELAVARGGLRKGMTAAAFMSEWSLATAALGHPLGSLTAQAGSDGTHAGVKEFCSYWKAAERTTWRRLATFREVFPEHDTPAAIAEQTKVHFAAAAKRMNALEAELDRETVVAQGMSFGVVTT